MEILETEIVQREWDGRWEKVAKIIDRENEYHYTDESGVKMSLTPTRWVTVAVYDFLMDEKE
jgi:hypothetical protein